MFSASALNNHLRTSNTIETSQMIFVEWNLNQPDNIEKLGNYRYRPGAGDIKYSNPANYQTYDSNDLGNYYTGATDSDIVVDGGFTDDDQVILFPAKKKKMNMLYSLEDCIKPNRPRSGINKLLYLSSSSVINQYFDGIDTHYLSSSLEVSRRPRYYVSSKFDNFKYWTSYRTEASGANNDAYGVSKFNTSGLYYIYDAAPFVVYNDSVPCNRLIVKMQTGVGDANLGPFNLNNNSNVADPLYGQNNSRTPKRWKIQILKDTTWQTVITFDENSLRKDLSPIIKSDGYVEIEYGIILPEDLNILKNQFVFAGEVSSSVDIPDIPPYGYSYLVKTSATDKGALYICDGGYRSYLAILSGDDLVYGWSLNEDEIITSDKTVKKLTNPDYYIENNQKTFREFEFIDGIRILVDTMNVPNCTFDLIEMSPRLIADITEKTINFSITKTLSDLGTTSIPVGNLFASVGQIQLFDEDFSFSDTNIFNSASATGSVIAKYYDIQAKFLFYDVIKNVDEYNYFIPIKTLYSQGFPQVSDIAATVDIQLRDFYFYLESQKAPPMMLTNISLSYAITILLDNVGFSNYVFKRVSGENDLIIPYFFIGPDQNVAEVLQQLAVSSQSAMFFDEYNNLVIMSKNYILADTNQRSTDLVLYGQFDESTSSLPNIVNLSSKQKTVYNGGQINYTTRYIQRSLGSIRQAPYIDEYKTYINKPVLLWEVEGQQATQTINELNQKNGGYSLFASPLKSNLSASVPFVSASGTIINNIVDFGEHVYWIGKYSGYMYANGEIIQFDAIEYYVTGVGNVWITNNHEYQDYFSKLKFNSKMYPTGNVRIYCEPEYNTNGALKPGSVKRHGRGQFGTEIVEHKAGLINDTQWTTPEYVRGCIQNARPYLFNISDKITYPSNSSFDVAGKTRNTPSGSFDADVYAKKSIRNGIIKNFMANKSISENDLNYSKTALAGTVQSSALVFSGPKIPNGLDQVDFVSYNYKPLDKPYQHFGTRMRVIGKIESGTEKTQTPNGGYSIIGSNVITSDDPSKDIKILGGSGGLAFNINPETNNGYYFEIVALSTDSVDAYSTNDNVSSYNIKAYTTSDASVPGVVNDVATILTTTQHDFNVGDSVIVSGLLDKDKPSNVNCTINGEFTITDVSQDRKSFKYKIPSPALTSMTILNALGDGTNAKYTVAEENFKAGQIVNISIPSNSALNISNGFINGISTETQTAQIILITPNIVSGQIEYTTSASHNLSAGQWVKISGTSASNNDAYNWKRIQISSVPTPNTFRINSSINIGSVANLGTVQGTKYIISVANTSTATATSGTITYVPLNTLCKNGGTARKDIEASGQISNVLFYKVVASSNVSEIIKKSRTSSSIVTLTTAQSHLFSNNDEVVITGVDNDLNGTYKIVSTTPNTFSYIKAGSNIPTTNLTSIGTATSKQKVAVPQILWRGFAEIIVDDGKFTGQSRFFNTEKTTVYDLNVEYINAGGSRKFYLYLNGRQVAVVSDNNPLNEYQNMALFVRGQSRCMFENVYAIGDNFAEGNSSFAQQPISYSGSENQEFNGTEALKRFSLNKLIQKTYLSGIKSEGYPRYNMYYEEFGTVMREVAYFNVRYDRAYPALYAKLAETINRTKAYAISGFYSGAYGAEFLIFNCMDKIINLDDTSGNYLRILGIAFTQSTTYQLTVDDYFKKKSNLADPPLYENSYNVLDYKKFYDQIKNSRIKYGLNEFSIESAYLQTTAAAEEMMDWIIKKTLLPRKTVGINTFATQHLQLGDIVTIDYKNTDGIYLVSNPSDRFIVYNIENQKQGTDSSMTVYLAEI